jgi:ribosomal protein S18 acetylase RimI-like enzyme
MMVLKRSGADAEIIGIAVSDDTRRKGIGKKLIQNVIESEGTERIKAQTDDDSIGFYRKCGFSEEKRELTILTDQSSGIPASSANRRLPPVRRKGNDETEKRTDRCEGYREIQAVLPGSVRS